MFKSFQFACATTIIFLALAIAFRKRKSSFGCDQTKNYREQKYYEVAFLPIKQNSEVASEVASFALPKDRPSEMENKSYQWKLSLVCGNVPHIDDPIISGWVRRKTSPQEFLNIKDKAPIEQAIWYGNNGYWYDLLQQIKLVQKQDC